MASNFFAILSREEWVNQSTIMWFSLSYPETSVEKWPGILKCPHIHIPMMPRYKQRSPEGAGYTIGEAECWWEWCWESWDYEIKTQLIKNPAKMARLEEHKIKISYHYYGNFIFPAIAIFIIKMRWFYDCPIFYNGNSHTGRLYIYSRNATWWPTLKKTIHVFLYTFWVKVCYTVSGLAIMGMYLNAWDI